MAGETNLTSLLRSLQPELDPREFGVVALPLDAPTPVGVRPIGWFQEAEGQTLIAPADALSKAGFELPGGWARITLTVHSSLEAVGLTAVIASALAREGVSANVVAAFYHDHVFVPWSRRHDALAILARGEALLSTL
ncbi:MAG: ACT domain-containing protein [Elsteraceae bacterium]